MSTEKEQWMDEVFNSLEGMQRAQPDEKLFENIEKHLFAPETKVIPLYWIRTAVAAAVVVLSINLYGVYEYTQRSSSQVEQSNTDSSYPLISSYNLYE